MTTSNYPSVRVAGLRTLGLGIAGLLAGSGAPGQDVLDTASARPMDAAATVVPLHSHPDDPVFGPYGMRGAGSQFKASFGAGQVEITPYLGRQVQANRGLIWSTVRIESGGSARTAGADDSAQIVDDRHYRIERGPVSEDWYLSPDGIEQTFTLRARPGTGGDFAVHGVLTGRRTRPAQPDVAAHAALDWVDVETGEIRVRYGAATLVDAHGLRIPLTTQCTWDGDATHVVIRVPGHVLESASFPITIDPVLSPVFARSIAGDEFLRSFAVDSVAGHRMEVTMRNASGSDRDVFAEIWRESGAGLSRWQAFADLAQSYDSLEPAAAHFAGSARFGIAFARRSAQFSLIRVHLTSDTATGPGQGQIAFLPQFASNSRDGLPAFSGSRAAGVTGLVAVQSDTAVGTANEARSIRGCWVNSATGVVNRAPFAIAERGPFVVDFQNPTTLPVRDDGEDQFLVAYERPEPNSDQVSVLVRRQRFDGTLSTPQVVASGGPADSSRQRLRIAGQNGEFLVGWTDLIQAPTFPILIPAGFSVARFRMRSQDQGLVGLRTESFDSTDLSNTSPITAPQLSSLAFDYGSATHWTAGVHLATLATSGTAQVWQLGWDGLIEDQQVLKVAGNAPYLARQGPFLSHGTGIRCRTAFEAQESVSGTARVGLWFQDYEPFQPEVISYGARCGGGVLQAGVPASGSQTFRVGLNEVSPGLPATLLIGFRRASIPLGNTGCALGIGPENAVALPAPVTTGRGTSLPMPIPLGAQGEVYVQWLLLDPTAPGALRLSTAALLLIR